MKRKLLVIFFIAIITSLLIYGNRKEKENVLFIGEKDYLENINYSNYKKFLYDNITYKELINMIKQNDFIIVKDNKIYLNQLISDSNIIIIGINNIEYNKNCTNNKINQNYFLNYTNKYKKELLIILNKMTSARIEILDNYCTNKNIN